MSATKFVLLSVPRTGSSVLLDLVRSHPDVLAHGEVFHEKVEWHFYHGVETWLDLDRRQTDPVGFVSDLFETDLGRKAVGFKLFDGHSDVALDALLEDRSVKKIILFRPNLLAAYSSLKLAQANDIWNSRVADEQSAPLEFDPTDFMDYVEHTQDVFGRWRDSLDQSGQAFLEVTYRASGMTDEALSVLDYLGVDAISGLRSDLIKLHGESVCDRFSNPARVEEFLQAQALGDWAVEE